MTPDTDQTTKVDVDEIIRQLDKTTGTLPEDAIRQARENRDVVIPRLIEVLQTATRQLREGTHDDGNAPFFALFLLTEFQAREALPAILEAVSLPGELPFELFDGAVTSTLSRVFGTLAGDDPDLLDSLIRNWQLNEYVRWEAAQCFTYLVRDGRMTRQEAVGRLERHLQQAIEHKDHDIAGSLVCVLSDLYPVEALETITRAFEHDLVEGFLIDLEDVEEGIAAGEQSTWDRLHRQPPTAIEDSIAELSSWAPFSEDSELAHDDDDFLPDDEMWDEDDLPPEAMIDDAPRGELNRPIVAGRKVGRNEPCPCGSGRKYKKCCGGSG